MTAVLVNGAACGGKALRKWGRVEPFVRERLPDAAAVAVLDGAAPARAWIEHALSRGEVAFVAAGGDGTVNLLVDTIMKRAAPDALPRICIGAVGLGSSNDFHKPFGKDHQVSGIPFRLDFARASPYDVGVLHADGVQAHWIVNASIGLTADANAFFNQPDALLRPLKRAAPGAAIAYAAVHTLAAARNRRMAVQLDCEAPFRAAVTNIGVIKNPNFTGSLTYRSPYEPTSGFFHVHLCSGMSRLRVLTTLWQASRSGFIGLPRTRSWRAQRLLVEAASRFPVEFDGETLTARRASFSIVKGAIQVCG